MIKLEQPALLASSKPMWVEIEILPRKKVYVELRLRYMVEGRQVLKLRSSISEREVAHILIWLEKAVKTRRNLLSETFSAMLSYEQVIVIEQRRIIKQDYEMILQDGGQAVYPYPFFYSLDLLVNPDPNGNVNTGLGMRFDGLGYSQLHRFLTELNQEIQAVSKPGKARNNA